MKVSHVPPQPAVLADGLMVSEGEANAGSGSETLAFLCRGVRGLDAHLTASELDEDERRERRMWFSVEAAHAHMALHRGG